MKRKNLYISPEITNESLMSADVITASGVDPADEGEVDNAYFSIMNLFN